MSDHLKSSREPVLLVGAGPMAVAYARVFQGLGRPLVVVGRGEASAARFEEETGLRPLTGALDDCLRSIGKLPGTAVVAVSALNLTDVTCRLIEGGVTRLLVEKPVGLSPADVDKVADLAKPRGARVFVGYNRRFYASVLQARELIRQDGGVLSMKFDFTEAGRKIAGLTKPKIEFETWIYGNSSHVIDLAFHLAGPPASLSATTLGSTGWHPDGAIFVGHGITHTGAAFAYHADWSAPGRWGIEVMTAERRLVLQPLEGLQQQLHDRFDLQPVAIDTTADGGFKPGLLKQVEAFLAEDEKAPYPDIEEHARNMRIFEAILKGGRYDRT